MSSFEVLCVTMGQTDFSKIKEMNVHSHVVYANQCDKTAYEEMEFEGYKAKMISTQTRGVGINRNIALTYASADICLMADDDVHYRDDAKEKILSEFEAHPDADVIIFHFQSDDPYRKPPKYDKTKKWPTFARTPWGSVRIAFRLEAVRKANAWFTTLFGGGCIFPSGEDSMWIKDLRKAGLTFYVSEHTIGEISYETSTWFTGYDEKYYFGTGACFAACEKNTALLRYLYMVFRTWGKGSLSPVEKFRWMLHGRRGYKSMTPFHKYKENLK